MKESMPFSQPKRSCGLGRWISKTSAKVKLEFNRNTRSVESTITRFIRSVFPVIIKVIILRNSFSSAQKIQCFTAEFIQHPDEVADQTLYSCKPLLNQYFSLQNFPLFTPVLKLSSTTVIPLVHAHKTGQRVVLRQNDESLACHDRELLYNTHNLRV